MGLAQAKLLIEAPVNGGRNYRKTAAAEFGPNCSYVNKLGYLLETPVHPPVLATPGGSDNP